MGTLFKAPDYRLDYLGTCSWLWGLWALQLIRG